MDRQGRIPDRPFPDNHQAASGGGYEKEGHPLVFQFLVFSAVLFPRTIFSPGCIDKLITSAEILNLRQSSSMLTSNCLAVQ